MASVELFGGVILLRDRTIQISIGFCTHCSVSVSVLVSGSVNEPKHL